MIVPTRRFALVAVPAFAGLLAGAPIAAQQTAPQPTDRAPTAQQQPVPAGPTVDRAAAGVRPLAQRPAGLEETEAAIQQRLGLGQARALMIVGFAAVVIGLIMDNDPGNLIAVGGAVVGLYGLYHYLR